MRRGRRQPADPRHAGRAGTVRENDVARRAVCERAAGHDELPGGRGDGRIAERERQPRDDARRDTGSPGDDRVQPVRSCVAADHVRGAVDHRCRLVGARRRQARDDGSRTSSDRDTDDLVALRARIRPPAEHVDEAADPHRRRVVNRRRQPSRRAVSTRRGQPHIVARGVRRGQAAEKHRAVLERYRRGVLHRGGQHPRFPLDEHVEPCRRGFGRCRERSPRIGRGRARSGRAATGPGHDHRDSDRDHRDDCARHGKQRRASPAWRRRRRSGLVCRQSGARASSR